MRHDLRIVESRLDLITLQYGGIALGQQRRRKRLKAFATIK